MTLCVHYHTENAGTPGNRRAAVPKPVAIASPAGDSRRAAWVLAVRLGLQYVSGVRYFQLRRATIGIQDVLVSEVYDLERRQAN